MKYEDLEHVVYRGYPRPCGCGNFTRSLGGMAQVGDKLILVCGNCDGDFGHPISRDVLRAYIARVNKFLDAEGVGEE